ncbi:MAG TPA: hypothetical protein VI636_21990 [Candidatus Angelobacter sp.]
MKSILTSVFVCLCLFALGSIAGAQTFTQINPPPCDFTDQFYQDNGLDLATGSELTMEKDGRFGTFRETGPPANSNQVNWVADTTCSPNDPTRRNFRILATTGGNQDDGNSPFTNGLPETPEFISILAFLHNGNVFIGSSGAITKNYSRTVGDIDGGLDGVQQNAGNTITITQGTDIELKDTEGLDPRGTSMRFLVSNFTAFAAPIQMINGKFAAGPCSDTMESNGTGGVITKAPTPCFPVKDTTVNGQTVSNAETTHLRQDWRFTTNRNAIDGSDNNCIDIDTQDSNNCFGAHRTSPFGYFCDDLLGMWLVHYVWFTLPPNTTDAGCAPLYEAIGDKNGFSLDGTPIILTESELNTLENTATAGNPNLACAAESGQDGTEGGTVWLVCPAIPDPRNGGIAKDAFLDAVHLPGGAFQDLVLQHAFECLQDTGKFCNESDAEQ